MGNLGSKSVFPQARSTRFAHFVELGPFCNMNFDALLESEEKFFLVLASILPLSKLVKSAKCPHSSCTP